MQVSFYRQEYEHTRRKEREEPGAGEAIMEPKIEPIQEQAPATCTGAKDRIERIQGQLLQSSHLPMDGSFDERR